VDSKRARMGRRGEGGRRNRARGGEGVSGDLLCRDEKLGD